MRAVGGTLLALLAALALAVALLTGLVGADAGWSGAALVVGAGAAVAAEKLLRGAAATAGAGLVLGVLFGGLAVALAVGGIRDRDEVVPSTVWIVHGGFGGATIALALAAVALGVRSVRAGDASLLPLTFGCLSAAALVIYGIVAVSAYGS